MIGIYIDQYCRDDISKIENYDKAIADTTQTWHCHHRLETHKYKDRNRKEWVKRAEDISVEMLQVFDVYYNRPACELIFLTSRVHHKLHRGGKAFFKGRQHSTKTKELFSKQRTGEGNGMFGRKHSKETIKKLSDARKGKKLSTELRKRLSETRTGLYWWNNGEINKKSRECPGEDWKRGRLTPWQSKH